MRRARRLVEALARRERHPVEQQRREHPGVAGVALAEVEQGPRLAGELAAGADVGDAAVEQRGHQLVDRPLGQRDPGGEHRAQAVAVGLGGEEAGVVLERAHVERLQQAHGRRGLPEPGEGVELGERAQQLGLGQRVGVVALGGRAGHARGLLAGPAGGRLLRRGVGLQAQRLLGGEHLEQVGQPVGPPLATLRAEPARRVRRRARRPGSSRGPPAATARRGARRATARPAGGVRGPPRRAARPGACGSPTRTCARCP